MTGLVILLALPVLVGLVLGVIIRRVRYRRRYETASPRSFVTLCSLCAPSPDRACAFPLYCIGTERTLT